MLTARPVVFTLVRGLRALYPYHRIAVLPGPVYAAALEVLDVDAELLLVWDAVLREARVHRPGQLGEPAGDPLVVIKASDAAEAMAKPQSGRRWPVYVDQLRGELRLELEA